jgi:hypothetical protein
VGNGLTFSSGTPAPQQIDDGLDWNDFIQPPSIPPDPIGDNWRGPPGPPGPPGQNADFQDAPSDGTLYGRLSATWARGLPLTGGTLSGNLQLPNGTLAAPSLAFGAADGTGFNRSANTVSVSIQGTMSASFFAGSMQTYGQLYMLGNKIVQLADATAAADALNLRTGDARYTLASGGPFVPIAGGTMAGPLMVPAGTANAPGLLLGTNSSGFYGLGASTAVASIGTQVMLWSLSGITAYAPLNMNNNRVTTVGNATAATDALNQQTGDARYMAAAAGPYAPLASPTFTGVPAAPTAAPGTNTQQIASTAFVSAAVSAGGGGGVASFNSRTGAVTLLNADVTAVLPAASTTPPMDGTAAVGTGTTWARADHVHPSDTSRYSATNPSGFQTAAQVTTALLPYAPLASPALTSTPTAPTAAAGTNTTQLATTAFVQSAARYFNYANNSGFRVNQRTYVSGTALAAGIYAHDRWKAGAGGCTYTFAQSPGPSTTITITAGTLQQVVEGASLVGGNYMLSWTGTAQGRVGAGSYAASPVALAGIVAGTNTTIEFNAGTLGQVKVEPGTVVTAWVAESPRMDLANCQRFYQTAALYSVFYGAAGSTLGVNVWFPVSMRSAPTSALSGVTYTNGSGAAVAPISPGMAIVTYGAVAAGSAYITAGTLTLSADL